MWKNTHSHSFKAQTIKILVVDDDHKFWDIFTKSLNNCQIKFLQELQNREKILNQIYDFEPDIAVISSSISNFDWQWLCIVLKSNDIKTILVGKKKDWQKIKIQGFSIGIDDFLIKPFDVLEFEIRIKNLFEARLYQKYQLVVEQIENASLEVIYRLAMIAEFRDKVTGSHVQRMGHYATLMGLQCGLNEEDLKALKYAAILHDIGKLCIPDHVLLKEGPLTSDERKIMEKHTILGASFLEKSSFKYLEDAKKVALYHHERWDGNGYPSGLKGEQIPLFARITAIIDVFDALTLDRPYRRALNPEQAFEIIKNGKGSHFDPELVDIFLKLEDKILFVKDFFKD